MKRFTAIAFIMFAAWAVFGQERQPSTTKHNYVLLRGELAAEIEKNLKPGERKDLVNEQGFYSLMYVQSERDKEHEGEIHDTSDDYHIILEGSALYTFGGNLIEPRELKNRPGEWRAMKVAGGQQVELKTGDMVFVPRGLQHKRDTRGRDLKIKIIKIYRDPIQTPPNTASSTQPVGDEIAGKLIGMWRLVDSYDVKANGEIVRSRGSKPSGILVYDKSGMMSVQVMNDGRSKFEKPTAAEGTSNEIRHAFMNYTAYFGKYEIDEKEKSVRHQMNGNLFPNETGTARKRFYEFSGEWLILTTPPFQVDGEQRSRKIVWERVK